MLDRIESVLELGIHHYDNSQSERAYMACLTNGRACWLAGFGGDLRPVTDEEAFQSITDIQPICLWDDGSESYAIAEKMKGTFVEVIDLYLIKSWVHLIEIVKDPETPIWKECMNLILWADKNAPEEEKTSFVAWANAIIAAENDWLDMIANGTMPWQNFLSAKGLDWNYFANLEIDN